MYNLYQVKYTKFPLKYSADGIYSDLDMKHE